MQLWQWVLWAFLAVLPLALMVDYWGGERLTFRGRSLPRRWRPTPRPAPSPDEHH